MRMLHTKGWDEADLAYWREKGWDKDQTTMELTAKESDIR